MSIQTVEQFDATMFEAALAYYGHPATYPYTFTEGQPLRPREASEAGQPVWVQVNPPKSGHPLKKLCNKDIATLQNITLDVEYSPAPPRLQALVVEFVDKLVEMNYIEEAARPAIEDSGAGCHIVIPITPLDVEQLGGGDFVNEGVRTIISSHFVPIFNELLESYGLAGSRPELNGKAVKLEGFDISRILSVPGTWRPGNTKPNETAKTKNGYLRRWVYPYVDGKYPERRESQTFAELVEATCASLRAETEAAPNLPHVQIPLNVQPSPSKPRTITAAQRQENPADWLVAHANAYSRQNRSEWFHAVVTACWLRFGDAQAIEGNADLIDQLTGSKYQKRAAAQVLRSLAKAQQLPRSVEAEWRPTDLNLDGEIEGAEVYNLSTGKQNEFTDMGNARRLVERFGPDLRYVPGWGWLCWDGCRWKPDNDGQVERCAKHTIKTIRFEAGYIEDSEKRKATTDHARRSEAAGRIDAMLKVARSEAEVVAHVQDFDTDPWLLNCANGIIDLRTGQLLPHDRAKLITRIAPVGFDQAAQCPTFSAFLNKVMGGKQELVDFIQRAIGYTLSGSTKEQVMFLLHGTGRNGKSTLLEALAEGLGDYAQNSDFNTFLERKGEGPRNDIARLAGARLVSTVEPDAGKRLAESVVKQLTGGDRVSARFLNKEFFEFKPSFKLFLAANHKPDIKNQDLGIWRRILLIPFEVTIAEAEVDKELPQKLKAELPGILTWALRGCLLWQRDGLNPPQVVKAATEDYKEDSDELRDFLAERTIRGRNKEIELAELFQDYTQWAVEAGEHSLGKKQFVGALNERGLHVAAGSGNVRYVFGLALKPKQSHGTLTFHPHYMESLTSKAG